MRSGFYLGLDGLYVLTNYGGELFVEGIPGGIPPSSDQSWGIRARAGYRINRIFSAELDGEYVGDARYFPPGPDLSVSLWSITANLKASADLSRYAAWLERLQPYGIFGVGGYQASYDGSVFVMPPAAPSTHFDGIMLLGGGVDFYVTRHIVLAFEGRYNFVMQNWTRQDVLVVAGAPSVQLTHARRGLDNGALSLGLQYRF